MQLLIEDNPYIEAMNKEGLNALQKIRFAFKKGIKHPYNTLLTNEELLKASHDSVAFKCYIMFSLEVLAPYLEKLIIEGNNDGSINAQYPKHLAQAGIILFNEWLNLTAFNMSPHEFSERILFLELLGKQTGVPVMDDELKEILMQNYETHRGM